MTYQSPPDPQPETPLKIAIAKESARGHGAPPTRKGSIMTVRPKLTALLALTAIVLGGASQVLAEGIITRSGPGIDMLNIAICGGFAILALYLVYRVFQYVS